MYRYPNKNDPNSRNQQEPFSDSRHLPSGMARSEAGKILSAFFNPHHVTSAIMASSGLYPIVPLLLYVQSCCLDVSTGDGSNQDGEFDIQ